VAEAIPLLPFSKTPQEQEKIMGTATQTNGRKTLASQLDRLDVILDALADNLDQAVATAAADAVKEVVTVAVQEAVHTALLEVLSNAEVLSRLTASQMVNVPPPAPLMVRLARKARSCWAWLVSSAKATVSTMVAMARTLPAKVRTAESSLATTARTKVRQAGKQAVQAARSGWMLAVALAALARRFRTHLIVAVGIGLLVGGVCYLGGREVASFGCGLAGFVASLASRAWSRLRQHLPQLMASEA
jgi:hypothetical protein